MMITLMMIMIEVKQIAGNCIYNVPCVLGSRRTDKSHP